MTTQGTTQDDTGSGSRPCSVAISDPVLDTIYDVFDDLLLDDRFEDVNNLIFSMLKSTPVIALAILTVTLPAKSKLPWRRSLYFRQLKLHRRNGQPEVLDGLE